jgi:Nif-specific regulatory protein
LVVIAGAEPGKEFGLPADGEFKIGRLPGLGITLVDPKASREHCRLFKQSTGWTIEDLDSRNGTTVNGARVKKRLLELGDRIRVGQTEFEFSDPDRKPASPPGKGKR